MNLLDLVRRDPDPAPWAEGDNIPWNDSGFSERMLQEHLSQAHDAASRRAEIIHKHVRWIHRRVLDGKPSTILDLCCGPGLYTGRLAALGHTPRGIDYGPASIEHANRTTGLEHVLGDVRLADYGAGNDLVMMLYGEINVFRRDDVIKILTEARSSLAEGGKVLLEAHAADRVKAMGLEPPSWRAHEQGLFSDRPHILLEESYWDEDVLAATTRYYVVDAASSAVTCHAQTTALYTLDDFEEMFATAGLKLDFTAPSLDGSNHWGAFYPVVASAA